MDAGLRAYQVVTLKLVSVRYSDVNVNKLWVKLILIICLLSESLIAEILFYVSNHFCAD